VTEAVSVTPLADGRGVEGKKPARSSVLAWLTVCVTVVLVEVRYVESPLYTAVRLWDPTASELMTRAPEAVPEGCRANGRRSRP